VLVGESKLLDVESLLDELPLLPQEINTDKPIANSESAKRDLFMIIDILSFKMVPAHPVIAFAVFLEAITKSMKISCHGDSKALARFFGVYKWNRFAGIASTLTWDRRTGYSEQTKGAFLRKCTFFVLVEKTK
jgi:hypothetical protein